MGRMNGHIAFVSGGAQGIGAEAAKLLVSEGAKVVIGDIQTERGQEVAASLGPNARFVELDVTKPESWKTAIERTESEFGPLSILVNNAGTTFVHTMESLSLPDYQRIIDVNQTGVFLGMQAAIPSLRRAGGGSIVNMSSMYGLTASEGCFAYGASKWAVRGMTKTAAIELSPDRIRVNSICPGFVRTHMTYDQALPDNSFGPIPLRRKGRTDRAALPEDVARLILFLASDESDYITGQEHVIDGGLTIYRPTIIGTPK